MRMPPSMETHMTRSWLSFIPLAAAVLGPGCGPAEQAEQVDQESRPLMGTTAYGDTTATVQVTVDALQSIVITDSGRTSDNTGREGGQIRVAGRTTGFAPGSILTPWIRFPGETGFSQLTANVRVADDGTFAWGRKTGKRTAVQIRSEDGSVRSNTVVIEAR